MWVNCNLVYQSCFRLIAIIFWFFINEWKAQSNCIHDSTLWHSSLVSSSGMIWSRNMAFYIYIPMGWRHLLTRWKSNIFSRPGHVIYFMFTNVFCKSRLSCAKIEVYHNMQHHTFSEICICRKFYIGICCQEGKNIF